MKKSIRKAKLTIARDTLKLLAANDIKAVVGAGPVRTRDLPCIELTARDCD